jgi:hypothetical protein
MPKYYVCSIGQPGEGYDDENLRRCIMDKCFRLHKGCTQRGPIAEIQARDILILKYQNVFIAYGRATAQLEEESETVTNGGWVFKVPVASWITGNQISKHGIHDAQISGSPYDAVKKVSRPFALEKIEEIGFPF